MSKVIIVYFTCVRPTMDAGQRKESIWRRVTFNMGLIRGTKWFYSMDLDDI